MYETVAGGDVHGESPHHVMTSLYTKASMSLLRGLPVYGPLMRWMRETVAPAELRSVTV